MRRCHWLGWLTLPILLLSGCGEKQEATRVPPPSRAGRGISIIDAKARVRAPDVAVATLNGSTWRLSDQKGKVVLVDFWATWCGPCRMTIPHMIEMRNLIGEDRLEIVGISLDKGGAAIVEPFVRQMGINYTILLDPQARSADQFGGVQGIPAFFLIDRSGKIAASMVGAGPKESLAKAIETLLQEA